MAENLLMGPHAMALSWKINGVKSSPLIFGKGPQLYAQKTVTRNLLMLQMLLWCRADILLRKCSFLSLALAGKILGCVEDVR